MRRVRWSVVQLVGIPAMAYLGLTTIALVPAQTQTEQKSWTQKLTPDGQPDLSGVWTNFDSTPTETPSPDDYKDLQAMALQFPGVDTPEGRAGPNPPDGFSIEDGAKRSPRRRSMIVDPPDGRAPVRREALAARDDKIRHLGDSVETFTPWERCITRGFPAVMFPAYNAGFLILQTKGYVVIYYEMIHETRVISLDGRPHLPPNVRQWNGDARGRWDGNTLVVDVTNYNAKGAIMSGIGSRRLRGLGQTDALHVVERFTRTDEDTIRYEATIDDHGIFTRPMTVAMPMNRDPQYQLLEYACHEGNRGLPNIMEGARAAEKARGKHRS